MPIERGIDAKGPYYRWGESGKRYHYRPGDVASRRRARVKAGNQARAIRARQSRAGEQPTTFRAPSSASVVAGRARKVRDAKPPSQRGMTPVGLRRMTQIENREPMTIETLRRVLGYLSRHLVDKQGATWNDQGKGWQAWHGWGGDPMGRFVIRTLRRHDTEWFNRWAERPRNRRLMRHLQR